MGEKVRYAVDVEAALHEYSNMVYRIAVNQTQNQTDADDVFQEVFLRLVQHSHKIASAEHLKAWLIRVTLNCSKKHFHKRMWNSNTTELTGDIPDLMPQEHELIYEVLALPPKYRAVIHLFYYEDMSIKQISDTLNIKESTISSQLRRGRIMLKEALKSEYLQDEVLQEEGLAKEVGDHAENL